MSSGGGDSRSSVVRFLLFGNQDEDRSQDDVEGASSSYHLISSIIISITLMERSESLACHRTTFTTYMYYIHHTYNTYT